MGQYETRIEEIGLEMRKKEKQFTFLMLPINYINSNLTLTSLLIIY